MSNGDRIVYNGLSATEQDMTHLEGAMLIAGLLVFIMHMAVRNAECQGGGLPVASAC